MLVVDNASSDGSVAIAERLADEHEPVRLLRSPTNRGYAGAVNLALPEARGEHIAVLNMDVVVGPGWLDPLIALLEANPAAGVACPLILLESDPRADQRRRAEPQQDRPRLQPLARRSRARSPARHRSR